MINLAILGLGHWGPNYLRTFNSLDGTKVAWCCDTVDEKLGKVAGDPRTRLTKDYREILNDPGVDAVVVSTPATTHFRIVKDAPCHHYSRFVVFDSLDSLKIFN